MRIFGAIPWFTTSAARLSDEIGGSRRRQNLFGAIVPVVYQNGSGLLLIAGAAAALAFGAVGAASSLIVSVLLLIRAVSYGQYLHSTYHQLQECLPYLEQLHDAQATYEAGRIGGGTEPLPRIESVEFDQVGFAYSAERAALCDVSFRVAVGDVTAVVGPSGAGKSTLAQLLLGLREPQAGTVRINGRPRDGFAVDAWFSRVAFVPQDMTLFDESVADCIRFHRDDVSFEQVRRAADQAGILDEILRLPQGFETRVGDRGGTLSHGQRQRICIARALVGDPDLLIFDEPTSALDPDSELRVLQTLGRLREQRIVFILAHRSATLGVCNKALAMCDGRVTTFRDIDSTAPSDAFYRELTTATEA
jgi:ABC-type multidrug transport system fused ATPase/permease subunit